MDRVHPFERSALPELTTLLDNPALPRNVVTSDKDATTD